MASLSQAPKSRKPRPKTQRSASLTVMTHGKLCLWIAEDGEIVNSYVLTPLASDFGTAYRLGKATIDGCSDDYDVLLHGRETSCTCPGHTYRSKCKHVDSLLALISAGKLPAMKQPEPKAEAKPQPQPSADCCECCGHELKRCTCFDAP